MASLTLENLDLQVLLGDKEIPLIAEKKYDCLDFSLEEGISVAPKAEISVGFKSGSQLTFKNMDELTGCKVMVSTTLTQKDSFADGAGVSYKRYFYGYIGQIKALSQSKSLKGYKTYKFSLCTEFDKLKKRSTEFKHLSDEKVTDLICRLLNCNTKDSEKNDNPGFKVEKLESYTNFADKLINCKFRIQPQSEESDYQYLLRLCKLFAINFVMVHPAPWGSAFQDSDKATVYLSHGAAVFTNFDQSNSPYQIAPYVKTADGAGENSSQDGPVIQCSENVTSGKYGLAELDYVCRYYDKTEENLLKNLTANLKYFMSARDDSLATSVELKNIFINNLIKSYKLINGHSWSGKASQIVFVPGIKLGLDLDGGPDNVVIANARLEIENKLSNEQGYTREGTVCVTFDACGYQNSDAENLSFRILTEKDLTVSQQEISALNEYHSFAAGKNQKLIATVCDAEGNIGTEELPLGTICIHEDEYNNAHPSRFYAKHENKVLTVEYTHHDHKVYSVLNLPRIGERIIADEIDGCCYFDKYAESDFDVQYADEVSRRTLSVDTELAKTVVQKIVFWDRNQAKRTQSSHTYNVTVDEQDLVVNKHYDNVDDYLYDQIINGTISEAVGDYYLSGDNTDQYLAEWYSDEDSDRAADKLKDCKDKVQEEFTKNCKTVENVCEKLFDVYSETKLALRNAEKNLAKLNIQDNKDAVNTAKQAFNKVTDGVKTMVDYLKEKLPKLKVSNSIRFIEASSEIKFIAPQITINGSKALKFINKQSNISLKGNEICVTAAKEFDVYSGCSLLMINPYEVMISSSFDPNGADFLGSCLSLNANSGASLNGATVEIGGYTNAEIHDSFGGAVSVSRGCASISGIRCDIGVNKGAKNILTAIKFFVTGVTDLVKLGVSRYKYGWQKENSFKFTMMSIKKSEALVYSVIKDTMGMEKTISKITDLVNESWRAGGFADRIGGLFDVLILIVDYVIKIFSIVSCAEKTKKAKAKKKSDYNEKDFKSLDYKFRGKDSYADFIYYCNLIKLGLNANAAILLVCANCKMNQNKVTSLSFERNKAQLDTNRFDIVTYKMNNDNSLAAGVYLNQPNGKDADSKAGQEGHENDPTLPRSLKGKISVRGF